MKLARKEKQQGIDIRKIVLLGIFALSSLIMLYFYATQLPEKYSLAFDNLYHESISGVGEITSESKVEQTFFAPAGSNGMYLHFCVYDETPTGNLHVTVSDGEASFLEQDIDVSQITPDAELFFPFTIPVSEDTNATITITSADDTLGNTVSVYATTGDTYDAGELTLNGVVREKDLSFRITQAVEFIPSMYIVLAVILLIFVLAISFGVLYGKWPMHVVFLAAAIMLGNVSSFIHQPGAIPDEWVHIDFAYQHTNHILQIDDLANDGTTTVIPVRECDFADGVISAVTTFESYGKFLCENEWIEQNTEMTGTHSIRSNSYPIIQYFPAVIGMLLARIFNLGFYSMLYLGRFFSVLCYALALAWAIWRAPVGKMILFVVGLLPMSLHLAGSFSGDTTILMLCFMFFSQILYMAYDEKSELNIKNLLLLIILGVGIAVTKRGAYFPVLFLCFLIPKTKFKNVKIQYVLNAILCMLGVGLFGYLNMPDMDAVLAESSAVSAAAAAAESYSFGWILSNPFTAFSIFVRTVRVLGSWYWDTMIGNSLSYFSVVIPGYVILGYELLLVLVSVCMTNEKPHLTVSNKLWCVIIGILILGITHVSMLMYWTPFGNLTIDGVQGRYFLPIFPVLLICLRSKHLTISDKVVPYAALAGIVLAMCAQLEAFIAILAR